MHNSSTKMPMCSSSGNAQKLNSSHDMLVGVSWIVVQYAWQLSDVQHEGVNVQQQCKGTEAE